MGVDGFVINPHESTGRPALPARTTRSKTTVSKSIRHAGIDYFAAPILNIFVPQVSQVPVVAGLPFFMVIAVASFISFFALHFTQYASIFDSPLLSLHER